MNKKYLLILLCIFIIFSCTREDKQAENSSSVGETSEALSQDRGNLTKPTPKTTSKKATKTKVNIYFENTMSMYGYVPKTKGTIFRDNFRKLLIYTKNEYDAKNISVSLINNKKIFHPDFNSQNIGSLNENILRSNYKEGRGNSDFDQTIGDVIKKHNNEDISILLADFIYSPSRNDIKSSLTKLQDNITDALLKAKNAGKDINIKIYRFISDFDGVYYDLNDKHILGIKQRPYFMFVIANKDKLEKFVSTIEPNLINNPSFQNSYSFINSAYKIEKYSALLNTLNQGRFTADQGSNGKNVKAVKYNSEKRDTDDFRLAVAVNLSSIPVSEDYLLDKSNYKLNSKDQSISDIGLIGGNKISFGTEQINIKPLDIPRITNCTHVLVFTSKKSTLDDINFSLEKNLPQWIDEFSIKDDRDIKTNKDNQLKTLGFSYIAQGIFQANKQIGQNNNYFNINIPVKMEQSSNYRSILYWGVAIIIIGFVVLIIIKNKSRK